MNIFKIKHATPILEQHALPNTSPETSTPSARDEDGNPEAEVAAAFNGIQPSCAQTTCGENLGSGSASLAASFADADGHCTFSIIPRFTSKPFAQFPLSLAARRAKESRKRSERARKHRAKSTPQRASKRALKRATRRTLRSARASETHVVEELYCALCAEILSNCAPLPPLHPLRPQEVVECLRDDTGRDGAKCDCAKRNDTERDGDGAEADAAGCDGAEPDYPLTT